MDIRKIKKLIDLIDETGITEIEITEGEESVRISRAKQQTVVQQTQMLPTEQQPLTTNTATVAATSGESEATKPEVASGHQVISPMVGTAYLAPSPDAGPYVEIGQYVKEGDTLCLIEAMKMFNQIEADKSGKIVGRLVENGQPVEYEQVLFVIEEDS